ncbi:NAD(P)/FAD-dependent oxidoreductase [Sphingomonas flavalba]|uniref:NAD(P)/FAD-dependent oxidoreductase n=1 Tax=Sphingomonas flavalba TaxID=2559804 RepID=UPI0039E1A944
MARAGASVLIVEAAHANAGASGQNAGSLHFQIERRFLEQGEAKAAEAAAITTLSRMAVDDWRGLEQALGADLHVHMHGGLMVAETAAEVALLERKAARERAAGLSAELVDGAELRRIAPYLSERVVAANHMADEGHADPRAVTPAFLAAARAAGATLAEQTRVTAIARAPGGFAVTLTGAGAGTVRAGQLLIAAGIWSAGVGALVNVHLPLFPVALQMNVTERVSPFLPHLIQHVGRRLSMKQAHAGNVLIGGGWPSRMAAAADGRFDLTRRPELLAPSLAGNLAVATAVVPHVAGLNLIRSWTGTTAITADQYPLVGAVPCVPGLFVAAGGSAFTLGPTFARLIAAQMGGGSAAAEAEAALAIAAPARFDHLNSFMGG